MTEKDDTMQNQMEEMTRSFSEIWHKNTTMMTEMLNQSHEMVTKNMDPMNVGPSFANAAKVMASDPMKLMQANYELWKEHMELMQQAAMALMKMSAEGDGGAFDRRFRHEDWTSNPIFDYIRKSYLITSRWMVNTMTAIEGLSENDKKKIVFHSQLLADAFAPSNFLLTNPEAIRTMIDTGGQSIMKGLQNLQRDLDPKTSQLTIMMSDPNAFTLGENIATTPGKIIYQNDLVQLIQYEPTTAKVHQRPHCATLDQQVLHSRPATQEFLHCLGCRTGIHGVCHLMGQP